MLTYIFPGQGSQVKGMGEDLFHEYPHYCQEASEILGYSISELCLEDPNQLLDITCYTQPAIYVVNALSFFKKQQQEPQIDFVAGHSLGEYSALLAAGVFDFATGLTLVKRRSELMHEASGGSMTAIIGLSEDEIQATLARNNLEHVSIANYNSYKQFVLSGSAADMNIANTLFKNIANSHCIPLRASGAFHSPYMSSAEKSFAEFLVNFTFKAPQLPIIANHDATIYHPATIATNLTKQISQSVQWTATIEYLRSQGEMVFEEIGSGKVLTGLVQRIKNNQ